jgi:hypothetical protein
LIVGLDSVVQGALGLVEDVREVLLCVAEFVVRDQAVVDRVGMCVLPGHRLLHRQLQDELLREYQRSTIMSYDRVLASCMPWSMHRGMITSSRTAHGSQI